jgi:uncharacterized protein (DUF983 family)
MAISRSTALYRGMRGRCPRCQSRKIFKSFYRLAESCPGCGLSLEKEDGWGLGAIPLNYSFTCTFWILPVGIMFLLGWMSLTLTLALAGGGAVLVPFLTYRYSKGLWVGIYYAALPGELDFPDKKEGAPALADAP